MDGFPGFSGSLFAVLTYFYEVGNVGMGMVAYFTVDVNFTDYTTAIPFTPFSRHLLDSPMLD